MPSHAEGNLVELDVPEGTTPDDVLDRFDVPGDLVHLVLLNGVYLDKNQRSIHVLQSGDAVAIWPPVAGG